MSVFLFILLVIVIIFRNEIKNFISYSIIAVLAFGLWQMAWWGKLVIVVLGVLFVLGWIAKGIEFFKHGERGKED